MTDFCLRDDATILYSTVDQIYAYSLADNVHTPLVSSGDKCLVEDHYLTQLAYLSGADRLLAVSALRPDDLTAYPFAGTEADAIPTEEARHRPEHTNVAASRARAGVDPGLVPQVMRAFGVSGPRNQP